MTDKASLAAALKNAQRAQAILDDFLQQTSQQPSAPLARAGVIQAFEFTFEAMWKLLQKVAAADGVVAHSPRSALAYGFQRGLWIDAKPWLNMLRDRNLTVHAYHEELAERIHKVIRAQYAQALRDGLDALAQAMATDLT